MTLLIALLLIHQQNLPRWAYVLAIVVWIVHIIWNSQSAQLTRIETLARTASRLRCGAQPCRGTACQAAQYAPKGAKP